MSGRLFKRNVRLTIARPTGFFTQESNAIQIESMRVIFRVSRSLRKEPNTADITVSNLSERTRSEFQRKPLFVRLEAGYDGEFERLFQGDVHHVNTRRDGTEWETSFQVSEGLRALRFARVDRSFRGGLTAYAALQEAAKGFDVKLKASPAAQKELRAQYASSLVMNGLAAETVNDICDTFGFSWAILDGALIVLRPDEVRTDTGELLISQETGMIGSPEFGDPPERGKRPTLTVRNLLYPSIQPGIRLRVKSRTANGTFKVLRASHTGDTHGGDWTTEVECRPT